MLRSQIRLVDPLTCLLMNARSVSLSVHLSICLSVCLSVVILLLLLVVVAMMMLLLGADASDGAT